MDKPIKPNVDLPDSFGGVKNNFSTSKILNGYEKDVPDIFGGANINYMLDTLGKRQTYYDTIVDFINGLPIGKTITTDSNNKLVYDDLRVDLSGLANVDLSNLTATGEKHFINKTQVTNCILEAPNGTISYSGSTITALAGIKALIPNGRNTDNSLQNIEYTLTSNTSFTYNFGIFIFDDIIFLNYNGTIERIQREFVFTVKNNTDLNTSTGSNLYRYAYVETDNLWYKMENGGNWQVAYIVPIAGLAVNSSNLIEYVHSDNAIKLYNDNKWSKMEIANAAFPSTKFLDLAFGVTGATYTAPANGYYSVWRTASSIYDYIAMGTSTGLSTQCTTNYDASAYIHGFLPVRAGDVMTLTYQGSGAVTLFRFYFADGEVN